MEYKYKAFISYNHNDRDSRVAQALHSRIETYTVPRKLRKNGAKKLGKVFRDQEELSVSSDLNQHIRDALDESEFLIVICSPGAVASKWVSEEIAYFLEHHAPEKVLTVLTGGNGGEIYEALLPGLPEPLSLDLTGIVDKEIPRKLKERFLKLCAPLLDCKYDDLVLRDQKRQRRIFRGWLAGITAVAMVIIGILLWSNYEINAKNREILLRESEMLTQEALEALEQKDSIRAVEYLVSALPSPGNERPYYAPAEQTLFSALNLFEGIDAFPNWLSNIVFRQESQIDDFCISRDGSVIAIIDAFGAVTCYDITSGQAYWYDEINDDYYYSDCCQVRNCGINNSVLISTSEMLIAKNWENGETIWSECIDQLDSESLVLSPDEETLAVRQVYAYDDECTNEIIAFYSAVDGTFLSAVNLEKHMIMNASISYGVFSEDGTKFCGIAQENIPDSVDKMLHFFVINVMSGSFEVTYSTFYTVSDNSQYTVRDVSVCLCDDDTSLLILIAKPESTDPFFCTKVDIYTKEILWKTYVDVEDHLDPFFSATEFHTLFFDDIVLLFKNTEVFMLDIHNGEQLIMSDTYTTMSFQFFMLNGSPDKIVSVEKIDESSFACVTRNGSYIIGYVNEGVFDISRRYGYWFELGKTNKVEIWNGGFFQYREYINHPDYYRFANESNGMGFVAVLSSDRTTVTIKQPQVYIFDYGQTIVPCENKKLRVKYYNDAEDSLLQEETSQTYIPVLEMNGTITIWGAETENLIQVISTPFPSSSIFFYKMTLDNQYLILTTKDDIVALYDVESGEQVVEFQEYLSHYSKISCLEDAENNRLYLVGHDFIACLSMVDWTLLTYIDNVIQFDEETKEIDRLVLHSSTQDDVFYDHIIFRIPTTEELVELAQEFLGN